MSEKFFTPEETEILSSNPFVKTATARMIKFTPEFKEKFLYEYENGKSPRQIISDCGIDPNILGESRIMGIRFHIKEQAKREIGFTDIREVTPRTISNNDELSTKQKMRKLEHELCYLKQELEFIKKIISAKAVMK